MADTDFVINADGDDDTSRIPLDQIPNAPIQLGGERYVVYCPKDVAWLHLFASTSTRTATAAAAQVVNFLDSGFDAETSDELERRFRDPQDPLKVKQIRRAIRLVIDHFQGDMEREFQELGLEFDLDTDQTEVGDRQSGGNRRERRVEAATSRRHGDEG